jgi:hypothetical protein
MSFSNENIVEFAKSINGKAWIALSFIMIGSILNIFTNPIFKALSMLMSFAGCGLFIWDFIWLKSMGENRPAWYTLCIYPWYFWKRGEANDNTKNDKTLFKTAIVVFVFSIICGFYGMSNGYKSDLVHAAQPVVSDIMHQYNADVDCVKVYDVEKMTDGLYRAKAMLSNTNVCNISIKENPADGTIYVTILED